MITGIILAAGESKRMGQPKQLLPWGDTFILQQVIKNAEASQLDRVLVILGYRAGEIEPKLALSKKTCIVVNSDYRSGMSASVKCGVKNAPADCDAFMLLLGDQPQIGPAIIDKLLTCFVVQKRVIVIPVYNGKRGHPVVFGASLKQELLSVGEQGAKEVVDRHAGETLEVPVDFPGVIQDIDTPQEYDDAKQHFGT